MQISYQTSVNRHLGFYHNETKYIAFDKSMPPGKRYSIKLPSGKWVMISATTANMARETLNQVYAHVTIEKPYGDRPEVDPYIVYVHEKRTYFGDTYYGVITPTGDVMQISGGLDGARAYAYTIYVKNHGIAPDNLEEIWTHTYNKQSRGWSLEDLLEAANHFRESLGQSRVTLQTLNRYIAGYNPDSGKIPKWFEEFSKTIVG